MYFPVQPAASVVIGGAVALAYELIYSIGRKDYAVPSPYVGIVQHYA